MKWAEEEIFTRRREGAKQVNATRASALLLQLLMDGLRPI